MFFPVLFFRFRVMRRALLAPLSAGMGKDKKNK